MKFEILDSSSRGTIIKVIGVGGAGGNAVAHMIRSGVKGVDFICANTDAQALSATNSPVQISLGHTGLGAGAKPEQGRSYAETAREEIRLALAGAHMVFITAGMGGGTGTGASPIVAEIAKELGILTVGVVTKPFSFEGGKRLRVAEEGIVELAKHVHSLIVILNENLYSFMDEDATQEDCFKSADSVLNNACAGIAEIINVEGNVNVDFEDVRTIMGEQGQAMMGTSVAQGKDRAKLAAEQAIACPLLEGIDLHGARGLLVNITSSRSLKMRETREIMETIRGYASEDATVIFGNAYDDSMGDELRVTVVATGLGKSSSNNFVKQNAVIDNRDIVKRPNLSNNVNKQYHNSKISSPSVIHNPRARNHSSEDSHIESDNFDIPSFLRKKVD
ncbi:cell division protein FtsZ [Candidatus Kinetoplastibacterium blastocrithidii TCC012E]|uniref:Cell division protein FtsZ n=1 Tax=Candidatus Kinetoplastidibacterium blastocrithidiae TCC012E TaxID=1208922 RepID=M1LWU3_9PROT|nr:cell division protein FtsZ [Candidatus Kinetoplastibacterium blastocrithidii]AFZ83873.1 cell division protein FtsZ [Candidatus Kinetoplastibacterium blastocrithidii (ex Strigomonas culicis)]AGF49992.1 cell division protein FtsZ [Candidatus Kinetoplastibacterium blastocrithidii TCC012E]